MAQKSKKGFTLVELIVVIALSVALIGSLGGGIITLQNSVKLDNAIRDLKSEIQAAQNNSRNSFITYDQSSGSQASTDLFNDGNISLGWLLTVDNAANNGQYVVKVIRQSVYFEPSPSYDFNRLRDEIVNFRQFITQKRFRCDSVTGKFYVSLTATSGAIPLDSYTSITSGNPTFPVKCSNSSSVQGEYFETDLANVILVTNFGGDNIAFSANTYPTCWNNIDNQKSIFYTSGYGEPVVPYWTSAGSMMDCQMQLENTATIGREQRALKVSYESGVVDLCGAYCLK